MVRGSWILFALGTSSVVAAVLLVSWLRATPYRAGFGPAAPSGTEPALTPAIPVPPEIKSALPPPSSASAPSPQAEEADRAPERTQHVLLVGLDRRPDGKGAALADSIVVLVLDTRRRRAGLLSVPRDLFVEIPGVGFDRINTVYNAARRDKIDPLRLLSRVVSDTLKLPIEHTLVLDLGVFERAIDALGGVDVEVPCPIVDRFLDARVPGGFRTLDVDEGIRRMDGATAAMYVRSRHGRSDWNRARRQQAVLLGLRRELESFHSLRNVPSLWEDLEASVHSDLSRLDLLSLLRQGLAIEPSRVHGLVLGPAQARAVRIADSRAVLIPDFDAIDRAIKGLFSAPAPGTPPRGARCAPRGAALGEAPGS